jgi:hypothetical protein
MERINTTREYVCVSVACLKGRMTGALICGAFGAVWMVEAAHFGGIATPIFLAVVAFFTIAFIAWPAIRLWSLRYLSYTAADKQYWAVIAVPYLTVVIIEWVLCIAFPRWLAHIHRYSLIPQVLGVIIGLHFLALARIFRVQVYYYTGAVMVLGALATLAIPAGHIRDLAAYSSNGVSLWATAGVILCKDWLYRKREKEAVSLAC